MIEEKPTEKEINDFFNKIDRKELKERFIQIFSHYIDLRNASRKHGLKDKETKKESLENLLESVEMMRENRILKSILEKHKIEYEEILNELEEE